MKIVIVGLGTGAFSAILAIKKLDKSAEITVIDKKIFDLQHSCGLPYAIEGRISLESLEHSIGADKMNITILSECEVVNIDKNSKELEYTNLKDNSQSKLSYDKLLLDTGSVPFFPQIEGMKDNKNVFVVKDSSDVRKINDKIKNSVSASVIGAGAIGLETAYALSKQKLEVTIIESLSSLFPRAIDPDISKILEEYLSDTGIKIMLHSEILKIEKDKIILKDKEIKSDLIVCATGVRPNISLAFDAGIKTSKFGIVVNKHMQTSSNDIYAAGDCIEATNIITGHKFESQLATTAYKQGTIAGENIAGKRIQYKGSISTFASVIGNLEVACTGLNSHYAREYGFDFVTGKSISFDRPEWFGEDRKVIMKIIVDKKSQKLIGAQAIGKNAASRINVASTAIAADMTLTDLSNVELSYCPAVSNTYDVLHQAVDIASRKIK